MIKMTPGHIYKAVAYTNWREFAISRRYCPVCAKKRIVVRLRRNAVSVRCLTCRSTAITMSLVAILSQLVPDLSCKNVYELSSRGPLVEFLKPKSRTLTCSEYFAGVAQGDYKNGVQCQDVQQLTYPDNSFDICTSTEVFEHVPNDLAGFAEVRRVLRPGGLFLFTVPIFPSPTTIERARLNAKQEIEYIQPAEYHLDPIRGHKHVLVYRDYGKDITERIEQQGFHNVRLLQPDMPVPYGYSRFVIVAEKMDK